MQFTFARRALVACALLASSLALHVQAAAPTPVVEGTPVAEKPDAKGFIPLFDGKTLSGWQTFDPGRWTINPEGQLVGRGERSHLFSPKTYRNLIFRADAKLNHRGNSGMYFRAKLMPGWPDGYESQVENTSPDPQKTGSLYNRAKMLEQIVADDTWWTQTVVAVGNRVVILVNDKVVVDFVDEKNSFTDGHLALQQHDGGSVVHYRNVSVCPLPDDAVAALEKAKKLVPLIGAEPLVKTRK